MTPDPKTVEAIENALADAKAGKLQEILIAGVTDEGHGVVHYNMDDTSMIQTLDWLEAAFSDPEGEILTYVVH